MGLRKITFDVKGEEHTVVVDEGEDGKAKLRENLGVKRLPHHTTMLTNKLVPLEDLSVGQLKTYVKEETPRRDRLAKYAEENPDMGIGWRWAAEGVTKNLNTAAVLLKK